MDNIFHLSMSNDHFEIFSRLLIFCIRQKFICIMCIVYLNVFLNGIIVFNCLHGYTYLKVKRKNISCTDNLSTIVLLFVLIVYCFYGDK